MEGSAHRASRLDTPIFLAVLAAAIMHGGWNVLVKLKLDRFLSLFLIQTLMGLVGLVMLALSGWPAAASFPYAIASGILHTGYNLFLARSYRTGDLSQVYPIARGTGPLLTFIGTWLLGTDAITAAGAAAIIALVAGIWVTAMGQKRALRLDGLTLFYALGTAAFIGAYSITDGLGGRASGNATAYSGLLFMLDAIMLFATGVYLRGPQILKEVAPYWKTGLAGAALSAGAYWIAIWAMTKAPIAAVAALRETSILFVIAMSALVLREPVGLPRWAGGALIVAGAAALRLS
jgi:drug/metabolite transporter (DMT)-like permease